MNFKGYKRPDGSIAIRNKHLIIAVDECCDGMARNIAKNSPHTVVLTNAHTCMLGGNEETLNQMIAVAKNPNIATVLVIAMGCGSISPSQVTESLIELKKPFDTIVCQEVGGTRKSIEKGINILNKFQEYTNFLVREDIPLSKLIVGVKCGGSDTSSGIASNPLVGSAVDKLVDLGATCIGGELFELIGCEDILVQRASTPHVADKIVQLINNENSRWSISGAGIETMSIGNYVGGLTTIEEKALGALLKMGTKEIVDILQINDDFIDKPKKPGFYLSESTMLCGGSGVNFASLGAHLILWTTGAAGFNNSIVPVIRISGNKDLINDDIDVDATGIIAGTDSIGNLTNKLIEKIVSTASGAQTQVEDLGESTLTLYQKDKRLETLLNLRCCISK
ncbi:altronate dehydratase large subunit [Desulfitispora alkaliphila]|uniref:UxaA family hydrolase n=1 Tax=Desulfitispora alkaliphila TaxID=622674 RepID=UPI003D261B03